MVAALWAMLTSKDLTCASEESMCAGDDFSESDLGRVKRADKIVPTTAFFWLFLNLCDAVY